MASQMRIGDLLLQSNIITDEQLDAALKKQKQTGEKLGKVLVDLSFISEPVLLKFLSQQANVPIYDLRNFQFNRDVIRLLAEPYARRFHAIVLEKKDDGLLVGMVDPSDITAIDELTLVLQQPIHVAIVSEKELSRTLDLAYRRTADISTFAEQLDEQLATSSINLEELATTSAVDDAPVIKLLQSIFEDAVQVNASDIHIEPDEKVLRIRLRIDGILHEQIMKEISIAPAIALRLKLMAGLNIAEKRLPQDGRFNITVRDNVIDVRLSTLPIQYGESIVMRLLNQSGAMLDLKHLGLPGDLLERCDRLLKHQNGLILVTGPTGCGKTTTLYAALKTLNTPDTNIITVEDPVEYRISRINQVQVNPRIKLTFANVLSSLLRHDPDIMMIGEMRDFETADIAMRAALTGHLVLSTLHTNDSATSALRLLDMGVAGYLVAATLRGVLAQRLVRRVCDGCKEDYQLTEQEKTWVETFANKEEIKEAIQFKHGGGCAHCSKTGYKGRIGVFELLELNSQMMDALRRNDPAEFSKETAEALKGKLLFDGAFTLAKQGVTTISEVMRISGEI